MRYFFFHFLSLLVTCLATVKRDIEQDECILSKEARRVQLIRMLENVKKEYYKNNRHMSSTNDQITANQVKRQFMPYSPVPSSLKNNADSAKRHLDILNNLEVNRTLLKPREERLLHQFRYFLESNFDNIYDNYYDGVYMLGPDYFCEQPICFVNNHFMAALRRIKVKNLKDLELIVYWVKEHRKTFEQYVLNAKAGVSCGMVPPEEVCRSAARTLSTLYSKVFHGGGKKAVRMNFALLLMGEGDITKEQYYKDLDKDALQSFKSKFNKDFVNVLKDAIVNEYGKPLKEMIDYFKTEHVKYCPPSNVSSGLGGLPLEYQYKDGIQQTNLKTSPKLPSGEAINVKGGYKKFIRYYTTSNMSGDEAIKLGHEKINDYYKKVLELAKKLTEKTSEEEIIKAFKGRLKSKDLYYNKEKFPDSESNDEAHARCDDDQSAKKYCPKRWKAINAWFKHNVDIMAEAKPTIEKLFYTSGKNKTTPDCLVKLTAEYNPSNGVPSYLESDRECYEPASYFVPFFKADMGPSFEDYNTNYHEARPGHHLQIQGFLENFEDMCGGISNWINDVVDYYPSFSEGWGLYAEKPLLTEDSDTINDNILAQYGALKWQIWRALRLIADVGFHQGNMTREQVQQLFTKYTWDDSDTVVKEITRYQGTPGQATSYMIGQQTIIKMREFVKRELGAKFDIKEFHYHLLKQGQSPFDFSENYIKSYVECKLQKKLTSYCNAILNPMNSPSGQQLYVDPRKKLVKKLFRLFKKKKHT